MKSNLKKNMLSEAGISTFKVCTSVVVEVVVVVWGRGGRKEGWCRVEWWCGAIALFFTSGIYINSKAEHQ